MTAAAALTTNTDRKQEFLSVLAGAQADLNRLNRSSATEIDSVGRAFKGLAGQAEILLQQAAAIVGCVQQSTMTTVLSSVQSFCQSVRHSLEERLDAATAILGTLQDEENLLRHLMVVTQSQEAIARHLRALSVLTNVEVARLGSTGGNFQLLAQELSTFSKSLARQTLELARDTENRKQTIADTRKELGASLLRLRGEMTRMADDIAKTLRVIEDSLQQQASLPQNFQRCTEDTAHQIAGVVAAVQAHDITRQQIEHVQYALQLIASRIAASHFLRGQDLPAAYAGLNIQICQLKTIQQTVANWTSQVRRCMDGIQQLSASDVAGIGPTVLRQEEELSSDLAHMEHLQQKSQEYSGRMRSTLGGLTSLVELVNAHLKRSQAIRDRLQILMFNSLIEAQRLGGRGAVVSAIASLIKEVSEEWTAIAGQSRSVLNGIAALAQRTTTLMEAFSEASGQKLREDQAQTAAALDRVRGAAAFVAKQSAQMQSATETMHASLATLASTGDSLDLSFAYLASVLRQIEGLARELEQNDSQLAGKCDAAEVERWLSPFYTTEIERSVMSAALHGTAMPAVQQSFAGNAVELF